MEYVESQRRKVSPLLDLMYSGVRTRSSNSKERGAIGRLLALVRADLAIFEREAYLQFIL